MAFARQNTEAASHLVAEALKRNPQHPHSIALKVKLLLLSSDLGDRLKAQSLTQQSFGISKPLDIWLQCLMDTSLLTLPIHSNTEIDSKCPFPVHEWSDG